MKSEHTPTPWETDGIAIVIDLPEKYHDITTTRCIAITGDDDVLTPLEDGGFLSETEVEQWEREDKANARFIVRACNNHDALVEALTSVLRSIGRDHIPANVRERPNGLISVNVNLLLSQIERIKEVLAKAKEE